MDDAKRLWPEWQSLLSEFRGVFTLGGWARFAQWVTETVLCPEKHAITQILTRVGLEAQWRNVEHFAEYGSWDREAVERQLMRLVEQEHPARWGGYRPVAMPRETDAESAAPVLAAFDGAYAMETVIAPCLNPPQGSRRIEFVTPLRKDARLYEPLNALAKNPKGGRPRKWVKRLPAPQEHANWDVSWRRGRADVYGRIRTFRYKCLRCCWSVSGPAQIIWAYVFDVPGYDKLWATITSAGDLSPSQVLSANGRMSGLDPGTRVADVPGPDGGSNAVAADAVPVGPPFRRRLVFSTTLEPGQTPGVDP